MKIASTTVSKNNLVFTLARLASYFVTILTTLSAIGWLFLKDLCDSGSDCVQSQATNRLTAGLLYLAALVVMWSALFYGVKQRSIPIVSVPIALAILGYFLF